jgi:hypothetical protein
MQMGSLNSKMAGESQESVLPGNRWLTAVRGAGAAFARALRPPPVWAVAIVCVVAGAHTALRWWLTAAHLHLDAMIYYGAARLSVGGETDVIFDPVRMTAFLNEFFFQGNAEARLFLAPWLYPPIFLLAVVPLSVLPFGWFYASFQAITAGTATFALSWRKGPGGLLGAMAFLAAPAAVINIISGQNAFLSLALLVGGFRLVSSRPLIAGALLGALSYKPQLALLVPVALLGVREWRALIGAGASASLLVLISAALFGIGAWGAWIAELLHPPGSFGADWLEDSVVRGYGIYVCALRLGAPPVLASAIQLAGAAAAVGAVFWVYCKPAPSELRLVVLLCGTALATPHLAPYDLVLVSGAVILLFAHSFPRRFMAGEALVLGLGWVLPVVRPYDSAAGALAPLVIAGVALYALAKVSASNALRAHEAAQPIQAA